MYSSLFVDDIEEPGRKPPLDVPRVEIRREVPEGGSAPVEPEGGSPNEEPL